jgi:hypothetical protein
MKHLLILLFSTSAIVACFAQTNSPAVIITSGTLTTGADASLSWTIGESLIESYGKDDLMLLQGFQEVEDFTVAIEESSFESAGILVYPISTHAIVNVIITGSINENCTGEIMDMSGKVVSVVKLPGNYNEINLEEYAYGVYLLKITLEDYPVYETKIIKY